MVVGGHWEPGWQCKERTEVATTHLRVAPSTKILMSMKMGLKGEQPKNRKEVACLNADPTPRLELELIAAQTTL